MKKLVCLVVTLCCLLFSTMAFASYPTYLGGDRNLILCGGHMGLGWYMDKSSLVVQKYAPPIYRIAVNVLMVENADRGNTRPYRMETKQYLYNWDERRMYWLSNNDTWSYIPPVGSMAETGHEFSGEMAFYVAYHMKFYGGQKWYSATFGEYTEPNCGTELYTAVDGAE